MNVEHPLITQAITHTGAHTVTAPSSAQPTTERPRHFYFRRRRVLRALGLAGPG